MARPRRSLTLAAAVLAAALAWPAAAGAQTDRPTGVSLTPGVVERELPDRAVDLSFAVANNEPGPVTVRLTAQRLTQTLDGTFDYAEPVGLAVEPAEVNLGPGERATVRLHGSLPVDAPALYAGLLAEPHAPGAATGQLEIRTRVAALLLLTTPGAHRRGVDVTDVTLTPTAERGTYRVNAVLRNTGDVHVRPQGVVEISRPGGPVLGTATLDGAVLLPGASRRLDGGLWTAPPEPPTQVDLDVVVSDPVARLERTVDLEAAEDDTATGVGPGAGLGELGGDDDGAGRPVWLVLLALALLFTVSALILWERGRSHRSGGLRSEALSCHSGG